MGEKDCLKNKKSVQTVRYGEKYENKWRTNIKKQQIQNNCLIM